MAVDLTPTLLEIRGGDQVRTVTIRDHTVTIGRAPDNAVVLNDPQLTEEIYLIQNGEGAGLGPFDSFLLLRGLKTLALRLDRQDQRRSRCQT